MNEQSRADRLSAALDELLAIEDAAPRAAEGLPPADRELARRLAADLSAASRARETTRERLLRRAAGPPWGGSRLREGHMRSMQPTAAERAPRRRPLLAVVGAVVLLAALLASVPEARALAVTILRQIGAVALTAERAAPPRPADPAQPTAAPPPAAPQLVAGPAAAEALVGAALLSPAYTPAGYTPRGWEVLTLFNGVSAVAYFTSPDGHYLSVTQISGARPEEAVRLAAGEAELRDLTVRGRSGVFVEGVQMGHQAPGDARASLLPTNLLLWEEGGVTLMVSADALGEAELLAVAEGLAP